MRSLWQKIEEGSRLSPKEGLHKKAGYRREKSVWRPDNSQKKNESSVGTWKDGRQGKRQLLEGAGETCAQSKQRLQIG